MIYFYRWLSSLQVCESQCLHFDDFYTMVDGRIEKKVDTVGDAVLSEGRVTKSSSSKSKWKMELRCMTGSLVKERKRANSREFNFNSQIIESFCGLLMLRVFPLWSAFTAATCPSCQLRQKQQSTMSPTFTYALTRRSIYFAKKASLRFLYSAASSPSSFRVETALRIRARRRDDRGSSRVRECLQREQAALCLRDSSTQGMQKACPHGVRTGSRRNSRQMGQLNFSSATADRCASSSKRIIFSCLLALPTNLSLRVFLIAFLSSLLSLAMALVLRSGFSSTSSN